MTTTRKIAISAPDLTSLEEKYTLAAVQSTWISSTGEFVDRFEREFAQMCTAKHALSVCNGTSALHLALAAIGVGPGDEVIVPSLTYVATANAVRYTGAKPVFVDVDPQTWCLDVAHVDHVATAATKAIIPVHLYGHPADMDGIGAVAEARGLFVIEDAAEAHTAQYRGRVVGSLGDIGVFSFYGNKILACGEGGALALDDEAIMARARLLRGQGMDPQRRFYFPVIGYNYRLTNVACALLCAQLERKDEILAKRRWVFDEYRAALAEMPGIGLQPRADWAEPAPWLFCITVDASVFGCTRDELAASLDRAGIETRPFFHPLHRLPPYESPSQARLEVTESLAESGLCLPTHSGLSEQDIEFVVDAISSAGSS